MRPPEPYLNVQRRITLLHRGRTVCGGVRRRWVTDVFNVRHCQRRARQEAADRGAGRRAELAAAVNHPVSVNGRAASPAEAPRVDDLLYLSPKRKLRSSAFVNFVQPARPLQALACLAANPQPLPPNPLDGRQDQQKALRPVSRQPFDSPQRPDAVTGLMPRVGPTSQRQNMPM